MPIAAVWLLIVSILGWGCATTQTKSISSTEKARMYVEAANGALMEGDPTGALQNLALAEIENPKLPEIYHSKALAYYAKHDLNTAIENAERAVQIKPDYAEANNTYGKLLIDAGKYDTAVAPLNVAANNPLYREAFKAFTNLGILYYRRGMEKKAEDHLNKAILASPSSACIAYYYRGHLRLKESKFNEAVKDYERATQKFCAGFADGHLALGIAYEQGKRYQQARKKFLEVQQRFPNSKLADQAVKHLRYLP